MSFDLARADGRLHLRRGHARPEPLSSAVVGLIVRMPLFASVALSLGLLVAGFVTLHWSRSGRSTRLAFATLACISAGLLLFYWVANWFTGEGINDAVVFYLSYGLSGAGFAEYRGLFIKVALAIAGTIIVCFGVAGAKRRSAPRRTGLIVVAFVLVLGSMLASPAVQDLALLFRPVKPETASFHRLYRRPLLKETRDEHPNLVFIYLESVERTYFDETIFPGLITGLRALEAESISFTDVREVRHTDYTIAGIVASQCGVPLGAMLHEGNRMASVSTYMPSVRGLGDLLHEEGYHLTYMAGAPLWFAGKGNFFRTHKFDEVWGRDELVARGADPSYQSGWGLYDDTLLELAYAQFLELAESRQPFGLFLLNLDTHHPAGHRSRKAAEFEYGDGSNPILNAVRMTDHLFSQFITRIRASPHGANTVIVVVSDHLAMRNSATELLQRGARRNLFLVLPTDGTPPAQVQRRGSTFDIASTVLPFLGYEATIGLGRDLRDPGVPPEVAEEIAQAMETGIWSEAITGLWDFPVLRKNLAIDPAAKTVEIDGQKFWIPILIRMDADMQTKLEFPWDLEGRDRVLVSTVQGLPADTAFLLIDRCENVGALEQSVAETGWCLIAGYGDQINTAISFTDPREFARAELRAMTGFWPR